MHATRGSRSTCLSSALIHFTVYPNFFHNPGLLTVYATYMIMQKGYQENIGTRYQIGNYDVKYVYNAVLSLP